MNKKKIIVGLSGGVDSAVAALLLKEQGHDVMGIFMQNWEASPDDPHCTAEQDLSDARAVCDVIGIPFEVINFSKEYWNNVFQYCLDEFHAGRTPNPDIWCNKEIKFKCFLDHALSLGADLLATGHYARSELRGNDYFLTRAADTHKDQTYFLYTLGQHELAHTTFPLADLPKPEVRKIAEKAGLINHNKKDSTGICFIGERNFKEFLQGFILAQPGDIKTTEGTTIGKHDGLMFYTLGQRKGLQIGGLSDYTEDAWYVVDKDLQNNILIIGQGHNHPRLLASHLTCNELHWVSGKAPATPLRCHARTRYHQPDQVCDITVDNNNVIVNFEQPQRAITPGQSVVFYKDNHCLGGGTIML
ncbi:MAG: tRNA 2-thiouridine(34) synthase MnmA [Coxiella sp. (in: Bacteria)]|nr:MAG: tRNA 2-thiouridine(34) synthase MnmA [Coxiella sp. (in: g-proteobacteria)]